MIKRDLLKPRKHITSKHAQWRCTVPGNNPNPSGDLLRHFWTLPLARSRHPPTPKLPSDLLSHAAMATSRTCRLYIF